MNPLPLPVAMGPITLPQKTPPPFCPKAPPFIWSLPLPAPAPLFPPSISILCILCLQTAMLPLSTSMLHSQDEMHTLTLCTAG